MLRSLLLFISTLNVLASVSSLVIRDEEGSRFYPITGWKPKPSTVEHINPSLHDLLSAISRSKRLSQPGPYFFHPNQRKRQIERNNKAAFVLQVNPNIPRLPPSLKNFSRECLERRSWCVELPSPEPKKCKPSDIPMPITHTCGPTKPVSDESRIHLYCNYDKRKGVPVIINSCDDECPTTVKPYTQFVACVSKPPPTAFARIKDCSPTTVKCHLVPQTYKLLNHLPTPPPPQPPKCDIVSPQALREPDSKFYILMKRSPGSSTSKRSRPGRRFRIVSDNG